MGWRDKFPRLFPRRRVGFDTPDRPCFTPRFIHTWGTVCGVNPMPLTELIAPDWATALAPVEPVVASLGEFLRAESAAGHRFLPAGPNILRAFTRPLGGVRVLVVGQDPYPTPGHAVGLSFSVDGRVRPLPGSLANIYRELKDDLGVAPAQHGDLTAWADQGVLLLNRVLTVRAGEPGSHRGRGWEQVTDLAISTLVERGGPLVAVLWGRDAQTLAPALGQVPIISSAHPSPLSASRGFFGSRPFSRANAALVEQGADPLDWSLPAAGLPTADPA
jgi:uracil-DNA glycosylase